MQGTRKKGKHTSIQCSTSILPPLAHSITTFARKGSEDDPIIAKGTLSTVQGCRCVLSDGTAAKTVKRVMNEAKGIDYGSAKIKYKI